MEKACKSHEKVKPIHCEKIKSICYVSTRDYPQGLFHIFLRNRRGIIFKRGDRAYKHLYKIYFQMKLKVFFSSMYIKAEKKSLLIIGEILVRYLHNENCSTFDLYNLFCGFSVQSLCIHNLACRILVLVYMHASCCKDMIVTRLAVTC